MNYRSTQLQLLENQSELESNEKLEIQYIQRSLKTDHPKRSNTNVQKEPSHQNHLTDNKKLNELTRTNIHAAKVIPTCSPSVLMYVIKPAALPSDN